MTKKPTLPKFSKKALFDVQASHLPQACDESPTPQEMQILCACLDTSSETEEKASEADGIPSANVVA